MLDTGHAAAFCARLGRHETGPLITDIVFADLS
jgi:hypothetical protein